MPDKPKKISLSAFVEQTAQLLRHELKKEPLLASGRVAKLKSSTAISATNTIEQIAKLLRKQVHKTEKKKKKR